MDDKLLDGNLVEYVEQCSLGEVSEQTAHDCHISQMLADTVVAETGYATPEGRFSGATTEATSVGPDPEETAQWAKDTYPLAFLEKFDPRKPGAYIPGWTPTTD